MMWKWVNVIIVIILAYLTHSQSYESNSVDCCSSVLQKVPLKVIDCVNSSTSTKRVMKANPSLSVVIVTRATKDIHSYAAYSYFLQRQYSVANGYELLPLTADTASLDYKYHRKIVPLLEAMEKRPFADYYVWMDSDLIILEFKLRFEGIASQHEGAHILMSQDVSNLANTGCIIVRNSRWSKTFLAEWLGLRTNPHILNEQIGFDHLYQLVKERDREQRTNHLKKIALLPHETLNSIFPAMREQLPHHQVLHMATDSKPYRQAVFQQAAITYCTALRDNTPVPPQLGITRSFLQRTVVTINKVIYKDIESQIHSLEPQSDGDSGINDLLLSYRDSVSKYCYAVTYQNGNQETKDTLALRKHSFLTVLRVADIRLKYVVDYFTWFKLDPLADTVAAEVSGVGNMDSKLYSIVLNDQLPGVLKRFVKHVDMVQSSKTQINKRQLADLKAATVTSELIPDLLKASVELGFELLQSIAKMGNDYRLYDYTPKRIRDEQIFLLEYILHGLDVMLLLVQPKMIPSVEAMKNDFLIKCGDYCTGR